MSKCRKTNSLMLEWTHMLSHTRTHIHTHASTRAWAIKKIIHAFDTFTNYNCMFPKSNINGALNFTNIIPFGVRWLAHITTSSRRIRSIQALGKCCDGREQMISKKKNKRIFISQQQSEWKMACIVRCNKLRVARSTSMPFARDKAHGGYFKRRCVFKI